MHSGYVIRPCDLFDLRLSTLVSLGSLLLTYIIILGQFRAGEYDQCQIDIHYLNGSSISNDSIDGNLTFI